MKIAATTRTPMATYPIVGSPQQSPGRRPPVHRRLPAVIAFALLTGLVTTSFLVLVVFVGAPEPVVTGSALLGMSVGWAVLALLATRLAGSPQHWAGVPAVAMAVTGIVLTVTEPGDGTLTAAGWVWPPVALALAAWMVRAVRRGVPGRSRWLLYPVVGALALASVGGIAESVALARDTTNSAMPGARYEVGGRQLHLNCIGAGSPTVVLENGLGETSPLWTAVTSQVAPTTRICAYDRAGQGWSTDTPYPQGGLDVVTDLHTLLTVAGEAGPYVLVGHSSGGAFAMTYAARYPEQVAGMVLLDSSSPHQFTALPDFPGTYSTVHRVLGILPVLTRLGVRQLVPSSELPALDPAAAARVAAFANSPRGARNMSDEHAQLPDVFTPGPGPHDFRPEAAGGADQPGERGRHQRLDHRSGPPCGAVDEQQPPRVRRHSCGTPGRHQRVRRVGPSNHRGRHRRPHRRSADHPVVPRRSRGVRDQDSAPILPAGASEPRPDRPGARRRCHLRRDRSRLTPAVFARPSTRCR